MFIVHGFDWSAYISILHDWNWNMCIACQHHWLIINERVMKQWQIMAMTSSHLKDNLLLHQAHLLDHRSLLWSCGSFLTRSPKRRGGCQLYVSEKCVLKQKLQWQMVITTPAGFILRIASKQLYIYIYYNIYIYIYLTTHTYIDNIYGYIYIYIYIYAQHIWI